MLINAQNVNKEFFGFAPPDNSPEIFAPGIISLENRIEGRGAFSADGNQFYFTVSDVNFINQKIFFTKYIDKGWSTPDTASFSKNFACWEPFYSSDNQKIYFTGNSEQRRDSKSNGQDFYFTKKNGNTWTQPQKMDEPINSNSTDLFFSELENGNIYFTSERPGGKGISNIYVARKKENGEYKVQDMGNSINSGYYNWDPCISPDESFMIFAAAHRYRKNRKADLFIAYNKGKKWSRPKRIRQHVNTNANEYGPFLSNDSKYLFFIRLGNGNQGDIYWIDLDTILKKKR
jgi:hypothetical protein